MPLNLYGLYGMGRSKEGSPNDPNQNSLGAKPAESGSARRVRLPRFGLQTEPERAALGKLRLSWGGRSEQTRFQGLVLAHLALIAKQRGAGPSKRSARNKPSELVRELRRRATQARRFAARLERPFPAPLLGSLPPVRELRLYSDALMVRAESLRAPTKTVPLSSLLAPVYPPVYPRVRGRPQKRSARPETEQIVDLMRFVREHSGHPHWNDLAVLLRRPCLDVGVSMDRLRALWKFWTRKRGLRHVSPSLRRAHFPKRRRTPFVPAT